MYPERRRPRSAGSVDRWRLSHRFTSPASQAVDTPVFLRGLRSARLSIILFSAIIEAEAPMGYYALFYREVVPDFVAQRAAYRDEHLGLAREAHSRGELILAGALADPPDGALLVFRGGDETPAQEFVRKDPYVRNGLVKRWEIRPWTVVVGNQ